MSAAVCGACSAEVSYLDVRCPVCGAPVGGALARSRDLDGITRKLGDAAAREQLDARLARTASLDELVRVDMLTATLSPADLADPRDSARIEVLRELEQTVPDALAADLGELRMARLVDASTDAKLLKTGLVLLRRKRYAEAIEWWTLQRARVEAANPRLGLLLLVLEALTYDLAGDSRRASETAQRVRAHTLFATYSRGARKSGT